MITTVSITTNPSTDTTATVTMPAVVFIQGCVSSSSSTSGLYFSTVIIANDVQPMPVKLTHLYHFISTEAGQTKMNTS